MGMIYKSLVISEHSYSSNLNTFWKCFQFIVHVHTGCLLVNTEENKLENEKDGLLNIFFEKIKVILPPVKNKRSMWKA